MTKTREERDLLIGARARASRLRDALEEDLDRIIDSTDLVGNDDEHDPDGSTSAYERAKAAELLDQARSRVEELDQALLRLEDGTYGSCRRCGSEIGDERLEALPHTEVCIGCAS